MTRHHNGEQPDDLVEGAPTEGGWLDAEISDSFPASDPLSHWAGPRQAESEADRSRKAVVGGRSASPSQ